MPDESSPYHKLDKSELEVGLDTDPGEAVRRWVIVRHTTIWAPPTDIYELADRLIVVVEIAGMRDGDFSVLLQGQRLIISGVRERNATSDCAYHQLEIRFGDFRTEVNLPWPVLRDEVSAVYRDGFLRVELPRAHAQKIQIVQVEMDDESDA